MVEELVNVLVSPFSNNEHNDLNRFSGILISERWVLTHSSILISALNRNPDGLKFLSILEEAKLFTVPDYISTLVFRIFRSARKDRSSLEPNHSYSQHSTAANHAQQTQQRIIQQKTGHVAVLWKCHVLRETFETLFRTWNFYDKNSFEKLLLPVLLLIKLDRKESADFNEISDAENALLRLEKRVCNKSIRGMPIEIRSTPFGSHIFMDSISRGIIANIIGKNDCLLMLDANAFPGSEGAPVYTLNNCNRIDVCGMMIIPISFCRGEIVHYKLAANLSSCLQEIRRINPLDRSVAIVKCGLTWGTAIFLDAISGTFLTCAHVVIEAPKEKITVEMHGDKFFWKESATLVYRTPSGKPYDVSVLQVDLWKLNPLMKPLNLADDYGVEGEHVLAAGFPFFSTFQPTISDGIVSKSMNCMLQSTCCVQNGTSGGPIIRKTSGEVLGLIVCNGVSQQETLHVHMTMAIPAVILKKPLDEYLYTGNVDALKTLSSNNETVRCIWSLEEHLLSKI